MMNIKDYEVRVMLLEVILIIVIWQVNGYVGSLLFILGLIIGNKVKKIENRLKQN